MTHGPLVCLSIRTKKERLRRDHLDYLQALSMLLTSINNMKTRELKSKVGTESLYEYNTRFNFHFWINIKVLVYILS